MTTYQIFYSVDVYREGVLVGRDARATLITAESQEAALDDFWTRFRRFAPMMANTATVDKVSQ